MMVGFELESERVREVERLGLLDTVPQERFDRITRSARSRFGVPIAEINLVDGDRQFTKSPQRDGRSAHTSRADSLCAVTIESPGVLVVPDALEDPRFSSKGTVTGDRGIRFYAGCPLWSAGHRVGTLCLIDTVSRDLTLEDQAVLRRMGQWVEAELRGRRASLQSVIDVLRLDRR